MRLFKRRKMKPWEQYNLWQMFSNSREVSAHMAAAPARTFHTLLHCEGSNKLVVEAIDSTAGLVELSVGGPILEEESSPCRISYTWHKDDDSVGRRERGEVMQMLTSTYRNDVTERRQWVDRASVIIGYRTYIGGGAV